MCVCKPALTMQKEDMEFKREQGRLYASTYKEERERKYIVIIL